MGVDSTTRRTRERVPPRRRRPRRSFWRRYFWPSVRVSVLVVLFATVAWGITSKAARPFRLLSSESRETQQIARGLASLREENSAIERRIKYLKTTRGAAAAARKLGYVKPGEISILVPDKVLVPGNPRGK